jgi:hypothetical protein
MKKRRAGTVALIAPAREAHTAAQDLGRAARRIPVFLSGERFLKSYGSNGLPTTFIVDRDGRVSAFAEGLTSLRKLRALVVQADR